MLKNRRAGDVQVSSRPLMRERHMRPGRYAGFCAYRIIWFNLGLQILRFG
ncbi:hypothetical protein SY94_4085 [Agrobacterium tumefaciens]|jgi:hypothetical protein|nr:hypothetical protein SY94_4085 [Agrobacterium tumefaciens]